MSAPDSPTAAAPAGHLDADPDSAVPAAVPAQAERAAVSLPNVQLPPPATLIYAVTGTARGLPYATRSELRWQPASGRYDAEWLTQADGPHPAHRWHSQGLVTHTGLMPERFAERSRSERAAHFDAEGGRVRFSANTPDAHWAPGGQDRLSAVLQLGALLAAAPERYPPGRQLTV